MEKGRERSRVSSSAKHHEIKSQTQNEALSLTENRQLLSQMNSLARTSQRRLQNTIGGPVLIAAFEYVPNRLSLKNFVESGCNAFICNNWFVWSFRHCFFHDLSAYRIVTSSHRNSTFSPFDATYHAKDMLSLKDVKLKNNWKWRRRQADAIEPVFFS